MLQCKAVVTEDSSRRSYETLNLLPRQLFRQLADYGLPLSVDRDFCNASPLTSREVSI